MQNDIEAMKKYYGTEEAWQRRRRYYEEGPSPEWEEFYHDVSAALQEDPASATAQALADRWLKLSVRAYTGDPEVQIDSNTAWMHREHWPAAMKRRITEFNLEEVNEFIKQAAQSSTKKYFSAEAWASLEETRKKPVEDFSTAQHYSALWQTRVDLFRDIE